MDFVKNNEVLINLCKELSIELPENLCSGKVYQEIENFKDFEYIYCIAYEMLIRTDKYYSLIDQYNNLMDENNQILGNEKIAKLDELIIQMNQLGLRQNSFIGFDCGDGNIFEKIKLYDEITSSDWSVRTLDKLMLKSTSHFENVIDRLISFYYEKKELYIVEDEKAKIRNYIKTDIHPRATLGIDDKLFIPCIDQDTNQIFYKSLADTLYLKELDKEFLLTLEEEKDKELLIQNKSKYKVTNIFWHNYALNDIKYGISRLIRYYLEDGRIARVKKNSSVEITFKEVLNDLSSFYIPCVDRLPETKKITMMVINENISLKILEDEFLSTLEFDDLKCGYIEVDPVFSRLRLFFNEARLISLPVNLNQSKEDLLLYISKIKDDYDNSCGDIVKNDIEYALDTVLESNLTEMPINIKYVKGEGQSKKLMPNEREKLKKSFSLAFYIYDLYKFFLPHFNKKRKDIQSKREDEISEIKKNRDFLENGKWKMEIIKENAKFDLEKYSKSSLMNQIESLVDNSLSSDRINNYLTVMKEFIHGSNQQYGGEELKKKYNPKKFDEAEPKYKNLIIGNSYIAKSNKEDLIKKLLK